MAKVIDATLKLVDQFSPTLRAVNTAVKANESAVKSATSATKNAGTGLKNYAKDAAEAEKINQRFAKSIQGVGKSVTSVSKKMALLSVPLIGAAMEGLKLNSEYTDGLAKVSTALDTTKISLQEVRKGLIDVSNQTGVSVVDLTQAEYQALSAGVASEKSVAFLADAMKASKAGFADAATTIDTVTTVLNSYGMTAEQATDVTDQMITAQNFGKTTFADMGASLGNVIPVAAALDVKTQELFASIATLTKNGVRTSEAITGLKAAYSNIIKPSSEAQKMAAGLGLEFNSAHLKSVGWAKFLDEVREKTGGNTEKMAQLFGSVEALNTVTVLAGKGHNDLVDAMGKMSKAAGTTQEAYEKMLTPAEQNRIALNQLKNAGMELSQGLTPILKSTAVALKNFAGFLNGLSDSQKDLIMTVGKYVIIMAVMSAGVGKAVGLFGSLFGSVTGAAAAITTAGGVIPLLVSHLKNLAGTLRMVGTAARMMFLNPWGIAIMAIIALAYLLYRNWDTVSTYLHKIFGGLGEKVSVVVDKIVGYWSKFTSASGDSSSAIGKYISLLKAVFSAEFSLIFAVFNTAVALIGNSLNNMMQIINIVITGAIGVFSGLIDFIVGVFTGDWSLAWQGVVQIFGSIFSSITAICETVLSGIKANINAVIAGINSVSVDIPAWVPGVGGQHYQPNIPMLAKGTENWQGGAAMIHDAGAEIVDLPQGSRVIPHDKSLQSEYERGKSAAAGSGKGFSITIESMVVREEADIHKIAQEIAQKLEAHAMNQAEGAV